MTPERKGFLISLGLAGLLGLLFLLATLPGDYTWVERGGGSAWVFSLTLIVLMPLVIPLVRGRTEGR